jgi:hypothetical protein
MKKPKNANEKTPYNLHLEKNIYGKKLRAIFTQIYFTS